MIKSSLLFIIILILLPMTETVHINYTFQELFGGDLKVHGMGILVNSTKFSVSEVGEYNVTFIMYCNISNPSDYVQIIIILNNVTGERVVESSVVVMSYKVYLDKKNDLEIQIRKLGTGYFTISRNSTMSLTKLSESNESTGNISTENQLFLKIIAVTSMALPIAIRFIQIRRRRGG